MAIFPSPPDNPGNSTRFNGAAYCLECAAAGGTIGEEKTALIVLGPDEGEEPERWSYGELRTQVRRIAGGLRERGLIRGDRVLLRLGHSSDFPLLFFGILAAGGIAVPTSPMLTRRECDLLVKSAQPRYVVHDGVTELPAGGHSASFLGPADIRALKRAAPAPYADTAADDPAYLVYTSGTSGSPKGVLHAHRAISGRAPIHQGWYGIGSRDRLLHAGAFNWTYTLGAGLMDPWANGATSIVFAGDGGPDLWPALIERSRATLFAAVPSLFRRILKYSDLSAGRMPTLRHGLAAGEALRANVHREWTQRTGLPLYEALGMSEVSTFVSSSPLVPTRPGSPGKAQPGRLIAILPDSGGTDPLPCGQPGLLCVHRSDPGLMLGYWRDAASTAASFRGDWFVTGDRAVVDADAYVWHLGRADDVMNPFGYRVAPDEIERVLLDHPQIAEVAVTDVEGPGEVRLITGFLVPAPGATPDLAALHEWCRTRLADYKRPKQFVVLDTLPRTASGKVRRRALRGGWRAGPHG